MRLCRTATIGLVAASLVAPVACIPSIQNNTDIGLSHVLGLVKKRSSATLDTDRYLGTINWAMARPAQGEHQIRAAAAGSVATAGVVGDPEIKLWTGETIKYVGRAIFFLFEDDGRLARVLFVDSYDASRDSYISDVYQLHEKQWMHAHLEDGVRQVVPLDIKLERLAPIDQAPVDLKMFNNANTTQTWLVWRGMVVPGPSPQASMALYDSSAEELLHLVDGMTVNGVLASNLVAFTATFAHFRHEGFMKKSICKHIEKNSPLLLGRMLALSEAWKQAATE